MTAESSNKGIDNASEYEINYEIYHDSENEFETDNIYYKYDQKITFTKEKIIGKKINCIQKREPAV